MESNCKKSRGKKKTQMSLGGDIGGLVVVGGALAMAGLFATFAVKRHRRRDSKGSQKSNNYWRKKKEEDYEAQGLRFLLQTPPLTASGHGDSSSTVTQEDRVMTEVDNGLKIEEMCLPNNSEKEITVTRNEEVEKEMPLLEDDREEDDEECIAKNEGNTAIDPKAEANCLAELIKETMPELKTCEPERSVEKEAKAMESEKHTLFNSDNVFNNDITKKKSMNVNEQRAHSSMIWVVWILSMLMVAMLLLSLSPVSGKAVSAVCKF